MEEILASIRRIIADDSSAPAQSAAAAAGEAEAEMHASVPREAAPSAASDVLDLTQPVDSAAAPSFTPVRGSDVMFREEEQRRAAPAAPLPSPVRAPSAAPMHNSRPRDDLMSPSSTAAVSAAFNSLASTVLSEHSRTLEDIVKEMMRPMLKSWLDENLPGLVERMVRAEIERVSRGGR
jgi:cell pole-organizing protein PopZ